MPPKQCVRLVLLIACKTVVERPLSSVNREIDALANLERPGFGRFLSDSQKQNMLVEIRTISFQWCIGFENRRKNNAAVPVRSYRRGSVR